MNLFGRYILLIQAISSPGRASEDAAWEALIPAIAKLKEVYEFTLKLGYIGVIKKVDFWRRLHSSLMARLTILYQNIAHLQAVSQKFLVSLPNLIT